MSIELSMLDTNHFDKRIARTKIDSGIDAKYIDNWCINNNIDMVVVRCSIENTIALNDLIKNKFDQLDTLVWYKKQLNQDSISSNFIRMAKKEDYSLIENIARSEFYNYFGHYHNDKRLDKQRSADVYVKWAISNNEKIKTMVYDENNIIKGFVLIDEINSTVPLYAVHSTYHGGGIGKTLIKEALGMCKKYGHSEFSISTQDNNLKSIGVWKKLGFEFKNAVCTFHKWYK